jgi:hypothetical protein
MTASVKEMVVLELDNVPAALLPEVLRFVRFIQAQPIDFTDDLTSRPALVTVPAERVLALSGLADLSGNAMTDTEQLYGE